MRSPLHGDEDEVGVLPPALRHVGPGRGELAGESRVGQPEDGHAQAGSHAQLLHAALDHRLAHAGVLRNVVADDHQPQVFV